LNREAVGELIIFWIVKGRGLERLRRDEGKRFIMGRENDFCGVPSR